ncbi:MAG: alkyl sulfatase C-terminal domain-containing protein, partial [Solirubrobacterales bacterium]
MDGHRAADNPLVLAWDFTDTGEQWTLRVENGALSSVRGKIADDAQATVTTTRETLNSLILQEIDPMEAFSSGAIAVEGDGMALGGFLGLLEEPDPRFPIVTPRD